MSFQDLESGLVQANLRPDPTQAVASGIFQITTSVSTFERLVNGVGSSKDTPELRQKLHKTRLHIGRLVKDTSAKLKQVSENDHRVGADANKKIANTKLAKDFKAVLIRYQKAQKLAAKKETDFPPFVPQSVLPSSYNASDTSISSTPEQRTLLVESRLKQVLVFDNEIAYNEALIEEREQGINEIHQQIVEINEVFKDLAVLMHEQGILVDNIESNIEKAHAGTAQAKSQLVKAAKTQRSNSSVACLIIVIIGIVLTIVIIVLAT